MHITHAELLNIKKTKFFLFPNNILFITEVSMLIYFLLLPPSLLVLLKKNIFLSSPLTSNQAYPLEIVQ